MYGMTGAFYESPDVSQGPALQAGLSEDRGFRSLCAIKAEDFGGLNPKGLEQNGTGWGELHTALGPGPSKR